MDQHLIKLLGGSRSQLNLHEGQMQLGTLGSSELLPYDCNLQKFSFKLGKAQTIRNKFARSDEILVT